MVANNLATAYSNQKRGRTLSTGRLVVAISETTTNCKFKYSDDGLTWTDYAADIAGFINGSISAYVDSGGTERLVAVWKQSGAGGGRTDARIYTMVGDFNAARTTLTWGSALEVIALTTHDYPDIVAHAEGTGGRAHIVESIATANPSNDVHYARIEISSSGVPSLGAGFGISATYAVNVHTFPSIDIDASTKRLFVAWSAGTTGAGKGIRFRTASYSGGVWTWAAEVEVFTDRYLDSSGNRWVNCRWDSVFSRILLGGFFTNGSNAAVRLYSSTNFTSFTVLADTTALTADPTINAGSFVVDQANGDAYLFGYDGTNNAVKYRKWNGTSLSDSVTTDLIGVGGTTWISSWFSGSTVRWIYVAGNNSPYQVKYDQIVLNVAPNTPTALQRTSDGFDTTPVFQCNITDPNSGQQIKAKFEIYQSNGVTFVGSVESAFRAGDGVVSAEFSSALAVGSYKVQVQAIDDLGLTSAFTAQVSFDVTQLISKDLVLLWNVLQQINKDLILLWNVLQSNQKDLILLWNVYTSVSKDLRLRWGVYPVWTDVPYETSPPTWTEVAP